MLKIKSNTNEFTIIFSEKIRRKINAEKLSVQPSLFSTLSLFQPSFSFSFSTAHFFFFFFFCFLVSHPFFFFSSLLAPPLFFFLFFCFIPLSLVSLSSFLLDVLPFFYQPKILFFSPSVFQFFSLNVFALVQPLFSSSFFYFILFWSSPLFSLSAPPFFLFFSSVYPRPNILSSCFTSLLFE